MAAEARTSIWLPPLSPWGVCLGPHQWSWQLGKLAVTEWVIRTAISALDVMYGGGEEKHHSTLGVTKAVFRESILEKVIPNLRL